MKSAALTLLVILVIMTVLAGCTATVTTVPATTTAASETATTPITTLPTNTATETSIPEPTSTVTSAPQPTVPESPQQTETVTETVVETMATWQPVPIEGGIIRLFYFAHEMIPNTDPAMTAGPHVIHSAISTDGVTFVEEPGDRFSYDTNSQFGITDPDIVHLGDGSWLMFVSLGQSLFKATSATCGGNYIRDVNFLWDQGGVPGSGDFNGTIRTFVTRGDQIDAAVYDEATGRLNYTGTAIAVPAPDSVGSPSIFEIDGRFYMVYRYAEVTSPDPRTHEIWIATSDDNGKTWTPHKENTYVCPGSVPGAVYCNGTIFIYGARVDDRPGAEMGVAISTDGGQTFTLRQMTIENKALTGAADPCPVFTAE